MSTLTIRREKHLMFRARRIHILLDGQEIAKLPNGGETTVSLPAGRHPLSLTLGEKATQRMNVDLPAQTDAELIIRIKNDGQLAVEYRRAGACVEHPQTPKRKPPVILRWWFILLTILICAALQSRFEVVCIPVAVLLVLRLIWALSNKKSPPKTIGKESIKTSTIQQAAPKRSAPYHPKTNPPACAPDYSIDRESLCITSGEEPPPGTFEQGTEIYFQPEPENIHDNTAVRFVNSNAVRGGYLYRSDLKEAVYEALMRGAYVSGTITFHNEWDTDASIRIWLRKEQGYTLPPTVRGLGASILKARKASGLTQQAMAERLRIPARELSRLEHSRTFYYRTDTLERIAQFANMTLDTMVNN